MKYDYPTELGTIYFEFYGDMVWIWMHYIKSEKSAVFKITNNKIIWGNKDYLLTPTFISEDCQNYIDKIYKNKAFI